ncbi:hypothetical protein MHB44_08515 [Lysinibacillus sp. FSL H8-0500]|uniref:hypothetical protein n=1 Tax=Lysinibacillus sp. FSL H8-0500 TaxID=2921393 RepID=UPI00310145A3
MEFNIEWYSPNLGTPIVSIAEYGIVFNKASIATLGSPHSIKIGFDREKKYIVVIGVTEEESTEDTIEFIGKEKNGFIRINNKDFVRFILRYCPEIKLDKAKRFLSRKEGEFLVVDLNSPADINEDAEMQE